MDGVGTRGAERANLMKSPGAHLARIVGADLLTSSAEQLILIDLS
jgi:hypothetical protein